jgi:hypothetical protein
MITKELLSSVLGKQVVKFKVKPRTVAVKYMKYGKSISGNEYQTIERVFINKYELAAKCKEWARHNEFWINSWLTMDKREANNGGCESGHTHKDINSGIIFCKTEPEAIFKACQWILENKELKDD